MTFFTRPDIDDREFVQFSGSTFTPSGETNHVGILKSKDVEIDGDTGATVSAITGTVLTYSDADKKIKLLPGGANAVFDGNRLTTRIGVPAVNTQGDTLGEFLNVYFFPSVPPIVSVTGGGTRQFGDNVNVVLNWTVTRQTSPLSGITVNGDDVAASGFTGLTTFGDFVTSATTTGLTNNDNNQTFSVIATTTTNEVTTNSTTVTFSHRRFFFPSSQDLIPLNNGDTSTEVKLFEGGGSEFSTTKVKSTISVNFSGQFYYYIYPVSFGDTTFTINGLVNNDFTQKDFAFSNSDGFIETFRVYRSNNLLNATFQIATI